MEKAFTSCLAKKTIARSSVSFEHNKSSIVLIIPLSFLLSSLLASTFSSTALAYTPFQASSAHFCQCVEFMNDLLGTHINASALNWPQYLPGYGYVTGDVPADGEVLTLPPYTDGADGAGHVALIDSVAYEGGNSYLLYLLGTNQDNGDWFSAFSCDNVSPTYATVTVGDGSQYWYRTSESH